MTGSTASAAPPPNVVMVLVDDARLADLSTMPYVSSMIGDAGTTFAQSYAPFPLCAPDRATLLTGQYAHNHGVLSNAAPVGGFSVFEDSQTIATWLNPTYETGYVGKYMNGYGVDGTSKYVPPGWDEWHATLTSDIYEGPRFNNNGAARTYTDQYVTDVVADMAIDFIDTSAAGPDPFFLVAAFSAPHNGLPVEMDDPEGTATPNVGSNPSYANTFSGRPLDKGSSFNERAITDKPVQPATLTATDIAALQELDQQRRESLLYVEEAVQDIVATLTAAGELDNTYIIFTSDNGFLLGEHRLSGKGTPYQESIGVPLMIRGPGIPAGATVTQQSGAHDIAPTVLGMTGRTAQGGHVIDGVNLLPMISRPSLYANRPIVLEAGPDGTRPEYAYHGIRTPQWKYVERSVAAKIELYDMRNDPFELVNKAGVARLASRQAEMQALLRQYEYCAGTACR
ncbi:MAG: sulfatase [Actinomycetota bacterium]|nr:sulfatase [Actinomycetota bacterium]